MPTSCLCCSGGGACYTDSQVTCFSGNASPGCRDLGLGYKSLASRRWRSFAPWSLLALKGGTKMAACSSVALDENGYTLLCSPSMSPHRKGVSHPICFSGFHLNPGFTLCMSKPLSCVTRSKLQIPWMLVPQTHTVPPGESLATLASLSQKSSHMTTWQFAVYSRNPIPRFAVLCGPAGSCKWK